MTGRDGGRRRPLLSIEMHNFKTPFTKTKQLLSEFRFAVRHTRRFPTLSVGVSVTIGALKIGKGSPLSSPNLHRVVVQRDTILRQ